MYVLKKIYNHYYMHIIYPNVRVSHLIFKSIGKQRIIIINVPVLICCTILLSDLLCRFNIKYNIVYILLYKIVHYIVYYIHAFIIIIINNTVTFQSGN